MDNTEVLILNPITKQHNDVFNKTRRPILKDERDKLKRYNRDTSDKLEISETNSKFSEIKLKKTITEHDLVYNFMKKTKYYHLAKMPIHTENSTVLTPVVQNLIEGYNHIGKPNGIWYAKSNSWLKDVLTKRDKFKYYQVCCYLYEIKFNTKHILYINNLKELTNFHNTYATYWLNKDKCTLYPNQLLKCIESLDYKIRWQCLAEEKFIITDADEIEDEIPSLHVAIVKNKKNLQYNKYIDWSTVVQRYHGIEVIFNDTMSGKYAWYDDFDLTSGCIWNMKHVSLIPVAMKHSTKDWSLN
jgi:hypothetical protein